jgi:pyruvate dehydrogenase E2 component (dihydrolipoamide acetyltransferase)
MAEAVLMPRLGQSVESCILTEWVKKKGDEVKEGEVLFCYETDKAAFEETAKTSGFLIDIFFSEGEEVPVLSNVAVIGKPGEDISTFRTGNISKNTKKDNLHNDTEIKVSEVESLIISSPSVTGSGKIKISPRARAIAAQKGINPEELTGSGPNGRIIVRDIESALSTRHVRPINKEQANDSYSDHSEKKLSNVRKLIAAGMHASLQNSAQLTHHTSADARKILELRSSLKIRAEKAEIPNISLNDIVCYAVVSALKKLPAINSHLVGDTIRTFSRVHLGIAVDTERGLMVPVIRDADGLSLKDLADKIRTVAENCRKGNIDPDLLKSENASFTVSNLGSYGIEMFTPVINLPQCGILGVNTITYRPADIGGGTIGIIPVIGLSLTYDHRALDGAPASAFLKQVRMEIENFSHDLI